MDGFGQLAKKIGDSVELLPLVYKDLAQPSVQKVGKALETVVGLGNTALLPVMLLNEKTKFWFEKHMNDYKAKLDAIPEDKICEVPPELGVPLLEKLTYTTNDEIADLFTTLLTKASSIETANQAHPKFVSIISSLSVDEARIIKHISSKQVDLPYTSPRIIRKGIEGFIEIGGYLTGIETEIELLFSSNMNTYLENLITLGILTDAVGTYKTDKSLYQRLHALYPLEDSFKQIFKDEFERIDWIDSFLRINNLGRLFIQACKFQ